MDPATIATVLDLVLKGISVIETLVTAGADAAPAIKVIYNLVTGAQTGSVTDQQLADARAALDQMIADFNSPLT
jgi:hypothetical protein